MNHQQEALYSIALRKSAGVGDITFQKLIEEFGSAERVWLDAPKILKNINKFNKNVSSEIGNEHHLDFAKKEGCYNLTLDAWADNAGAVRFYERLGMKVQKYVFEHIL